jgi:hypothetical protein
MEMTERYKAQGTWYTAENTGSQINRKDFLKKVIRVGLLFILGLVAIALGSKVTSAQECSNCPGNGICKGETDCSKFLPDQK